MFDFQTLERALSSRVRGARLEHVYRVTDLATHLAGIHGLDPAPARAAGLMHDYARDMSDPELLALAEGWGLISDPSERDHPRALLHAPVAAALLEQEGLITDPAVLDAIRYHTTGAPQMSRLARLLWVADMVEPGRDFPGVPGLRELAHQDLDLALLAGLDHTLGYLITAGRRVHPLTMAARNWLLGEVRQAGKPWHGYRFPG